LHLSRDQSLDAVAGRRTHLDTAGGTVQITESYTVAVVLLSKNGFDTGLMEEMFAVQLHSGSLTEDICIANHAVLFRMYSESVLMVISYAAWNKAWQTLILFLSTETSMSTVFMNLGARLLHKLNAIRVIADFIKSLGIINGLLILTKDISAKSADSVLEVCLVFFTGISDVIGF
jgi:hypothetical protein